MGTKRFQVLTNVAKGIQTITHPVRVCVRVLNDPNIHEHNGEQRRTPNERLRQWSVEGI